MALTKAQQTKLEELTQAALLSVHTVNGTVEPPQFYSPGRTVEPVFSSNMDTLGWYRIAGWKTEYRVEHGFIRDGCWFMDRVRGTSGSRLEGHERLYMSEKDAWLAVYCRIRDHAAQELLKVWGKHQASTDNPGLRVPT